MKRKARDNKKEHISKIELVANDVLLLLLSFVGLDNSTYINARLTTKMWNLNALFKYFIFSLRGTDLLKVKNLPFCSLSIRCLPLDEVSLQILQKLDTVKKLNVHLLPLPNVGEKIYPLIQYPSLLTHLTLNSNDVNDRFSNYDALFPHLKSLKLNCSTKLFPFSIANLQGLQSLDIQNCPHMYLPLDLSQFPLLQKLKISNAVLLSRFGNLQHITKLVIGRMWRWWDFHGCFLLNTKHLTIYNITSDNVDLSDFPTQCFPNLISLTLGTNNFKTLNFPKSLLPSFTSLKFLNK
jgi:hypothetical protein